MKREDTTTSTHLAHELRFLNKTKHQQQQQHTFNDPGKNNYQA